MLIALITLTLLSCPIALLGDESCDARTEDKNCSSRGSVLSEGALGATTVELSNGVKMPLLGLGTVKVKGYGQVYRALEAALDAGYRLIDTADSHGNHVDIGRALQELLPAKGLTRSDIFLTSKLDPKDIGTAPCRNTINQILEELDTDYLDLFLIEMPPVEHPKRRLAWKCLTDHYKKGVFRAIGVSEYDAEQINEMKAYSNIIPQVNQVLHNPELFGRLLLKWGPVTKSYCESKNIHMASQSSLGGRTEAMIERPALQELSKKYSKSPSQMLLRWGVQKNYTVLPSSSNPDHIKQNIDIFDFEISDEDMEAIYDIFKHKTITKNPLSQPVAPSP